MPGIDIVVIGDYHSDPDVPNNRADWIGGYIRDHRPAAIVDMGDFCSFGSLSTYEKRGAKVMEGKTYAGDVAHAVDARERLMAPCHRLRSYNPALHGLLGNHEARVGRAIDADPQHLDGTYDYDDLQHARLGWTRHAYLNPVIINGVGFIHHVVNPANGKPPAGIYQAKRALEMAFGSVVVGHNHIIDVAETVGLDGRRRIGLCAGWCGDPDQVEHWAPKLQQRKWNKCLVHLKDVHRGEFYYEVIPMTVLRKRYG